MLELGGDWEQGEWDSYWWSPGVRSWGLGVLSTKLERDESLVLFIQKKLAYIWWASIRNTFVGLCAKSLQSLWPHGLQHLALSVQEILQARILEWVAMPSSRGSFRPRDQTLLLIYNIYYPSYIGRWVLYNWCHREAWDIYLTPWQIKLYLHLCWILSGYHYYHLDVRSVGKKELTILFKLLC